MKAKFTTYMDIDLPGMETMELANLRDEINRIIHGRQTTDNPPIAKVLRDTRAMNAFETIFQKHPNFITVKDVAGLTLERLEKERNIGKKSVSSINDLLVTYGHSPLK